MKWIKKFENAEEDQIPNRFNEDKIDEYFQGLVDDWDVEIEYDSETYGDAYSDILAIEVKIGRKLWSKFPRLQRMHKTMENVLEYHNMDVYFRFMSDLKKCIDHLISSSGDYECTLITQSEYSKLTIMIE
jgi:hypothetical protein